VRDERVGGYDAHSDEQSTTEFGALWRRGIE
jgi:hypothetical protein